MPPSRKYCVEQHFALLFSLKALKTSLYLSISVLQWTLVSSIDGKHCLMSARKTVSLAHFSHGQWQQTLATGWCCPVTTVALSQKSTVLLQK